MHTTRISPNTHFTLPFDLPRQRRVIDLFVESDRPVRAFIVDETQLAAFRAGKKYKIYGSSRASVRHDTRVWMPSGTWVFVVVNSNTESVLVSFDLT